MGYKELIGALHEEGEAKIRAIRKDTEEEAGKIREEAFRRIREMKEGYERALSGMLNERTKDILLDAEREARAALLGSEKALSERLYALSLQTLPVLREGTYAEIFDSLAQEIPDYGWQQIRVAPEDREAARKHFPEGEIVPDPSIIGGLDVTDRDGRVRVINTLEKRLANAWEEVLPELIRDMYERS
ncbi:MAG TPA: V-type ATP synthase subunit E [Thermodesulfovibrionales bacterium]|nr:V-type ATP synthase subunit E [Thermodesulfovibrionales bacterium]